MTETTETTTTTTTNGDAPNATPADAATAAAVDAIDRMTGKSVPRPGTPHASRAALLEYRRANGDANYRGYTSATAAGVKTWADVKPGLYPLRDARDRFAVRVTQNVGRAATPAVPASGDTPATPKRVGIPRGGFKFTIWYDGRPVRGYVAGDFHAAAVRRIFGAVLTAKSVNARGQKFIADKTVDADAVYCVPADGTIPNA